MKKLKSLVCKLMVVVVVGLTIVATPGLVPQHMLLQEKQIYSHMV